MKVVLANPRGFCAGVDRAIAIVDSILKKYGAPIYVHNEVVHNKFVVDNFIQKGVIFVNNLAKIPIDSVIIFSAHGVSQKVRKQAHKITNKIYDATCPLVTKVHKEVKRKDNNGFQVVLIGHKNHPEVEGTLGQANNIILLENIEQIDNLTLNDNVSYATQTTLSVDDTQKIIDKLKYKFPNIIAPKKDDICYATQNRQNAVKKIMQNADILLVLGSKNSSNSNRLREIAISMNKKSYLIDSASQIKKEWLNNVTIVGVTAGASAPEILVQEVIKYLNADEVVEINSIKENVNFC